MTLHGLPSSIRWGALSVVSIVIGGWGQTVAALDVSAEQIVKNGESIVTAHVNAKDDRWRFEYVQPQGGQYHDRSDGQAAFVAHPLEAASVP